jgi:hypothetical protein
VVSLVFLVLEVAKIPPKEPFGFIQGPLLIVRGLDFGLNLV